MRWKLKKTKPKQATKAPDKPTQAMNAQEKPTQATPRKSVGEKTVRSKTTPSHPIDSESDSCDRCRSPACLCHRLGSGWVGCLLQLRPRQSQDLTRRNFCSLATISLWIAYQPKIIPRHFDCPPHKYSCGSGACQVSRSYSGIVGIYLVILEAPYKCLSLALV